MANVLLTLNAGSSSIKFEAFSLSEAGMERLASGQIEGLGATATFSVRSSSGEKHQFEINEAGGSVEVPALRSLRVHLNPDIVDR